MSDHALLIVDDDDDIRETLADLLLDSGYKVLTATNGQQALDVLRTQAPICLVLLDLMMPVMDGWAFRAAQQADPSIRDIPVIVVTASGHQNGALGQLSILRKPLRIETVLAAVEQHCPLAA